MRVRAPFLFLVLLPCVALAGRDLRSEFLAAFRAADRGAHDTEELRGYPLYPWLEAERLRVRVERSPDGAVDSAVETFLERHGQAPYTQALRATWWDSLHERRRFAELVVALGGRPEAPTRLCQWLRALQAVGREDVLREDALFAWKQGRSMPDACDPAFDWLRASGLLTPERIEARLRLALDAGEHRLARHLIERLPEARRRAWTNARLAREEGRSFLERLIREPAAPIPFVDLEAGLHGLARRDAESARSILPRLLASRRFAEEERHALVLAVAAPSAWSRDPEALALFRRVPLAAHDEAELEWRVRAALWAGEWEEVARSIAAMPKPLAEHVRWRYWAARAAVARGEAEPEDAYRDLARDRSFHGFLAAERIGEEPALAPGRTERDAEIRRRLETDPAIRRAREWYALEDDRRAAAELAFALEGAEAATQEQAAAMLADWDWHPQAIAWLARSDRWDDLLLRFPLPFEREFERAAKTSGVPLVWLHTIVRTESLYDVRAVSGAGARGIAQVMPATARAVARRNDLRYHGAEDLFDVGTNLVFGAHYLRELAEKFAGDWLLVIPAYNAGPHRIPRWLPPAPLEADVWMENIPFHETRGYLQRALYHYVIVHWRLTGEPGDLSPWVERVVASAPSSSEESTNVVPPSRRPIRSS